MGNSESQVANTETWDGTSWTEVNDLNTARNDGGASGTPSAALFFGGGTPSISATTEFLGNSESQVANTETWNGS